MAVGFTETSPLEEIKGIRLGVARAQGRYRDRPDLLIIELAEGSTVAATFTRNAFCAAPVEVARAHLKATSPRFLLVNAGNANAGTGRQGWEDAVACCAEVARLRGCRKEAVLPFSTGVIGEPLPVSLIMAGIPKALADLDTQHWPKAARAIMTTDTVAKAASRRLRWEGQSYAVTGIAKGSGMIRPDMATLLAFLATDAPLPLSLLQGCLASAVEGSFNRITVDGDTSTNDACVLVATGRGGGAALSGSDSTATRAFAATLEEVCTVLAQSIVRDGEGATKFITVAVGQGQTSEECLDVAYAIAHSPLVKTAFFASDPNWGRILAAVGRAGLAHLDITKVAIWLDDCCIVNNGARAPEYQEAEGCRIMAKSEITVRVDLGRGTQGATVWTCDLSHGYVSINADYRS
ncbi:MAG: bifunctional glutamate N-acetyltransferase/amino-acid acetyltransferase ArgJ [Gammaproteobacteria bacterium]|jgi:glutamate N-acetyltransferase/amino-acid N-acetyltransferase